MADHRQIDFYNGHPTLAFDEALARDCFHVLDRWDALAIPSGDLSIAFLTDAELAALHGTFLDDPSPTDVITFPGSPNREIDADAGEICISVDTAHAAAREWGHSLSEELNLYLVHGWLHLAGLSDKTPEAAENMRRAERAALDLLKKNTTLPQFHL